MKSFTRLPPHQDRPTPGKGWEDRSRGGPRVPLVPRSRLPTVSLHKACRCADTCLRCWRAARCGGTKWTTTSCLRAPMWRHAPRPSRSSSSLVGRSGLRPVTVTLTVTVIWRIWQGGTTSPPGTAPRARPPRTRAGTDRGAGSWRRSSRRCTGMQRPRCCAPTSTRRAARSRSSASSTRTSTTGSPIEVRSPRTPAASRRTTPTRRTRSRTRVTLARARTRQSTTPTPRTTRPGRRCATCSAGEGSFGLRAR